LPYLIKTCDIPDRNFDATGGNYLIGLSPYSAARLFKGAIDEVAVFSRALGATEIEAAYNAGFLGDGYCGAATSAITIVKDADPVTSQAFSFSGDLGDFSLVDSGAGSGNLTTFLTFHRVLTR
jgi:hypothetical protein